MDKVVNGSSVIRDQGQDVHFHDYGSYLDAISKNNILPFSNIKIFFSDDVWDFSGMRTVNVRASSMRFCFSDVPYSFRDEAKKYMLYKLLHGNMKMQSLQIDFGVIRRFFIFSEEKPYTSVKHLEYELIKAFLDLTAHRSKSYQRQNAKALRDFLSYYAIHYEDIRTPSILHILDDKNFALSPVERKNRKVPDIPSFYYSSFLQTALDMIDSDETPFHIKTATCVLLILSQTGLRISEVLDLECGCLREANSYSQNKLFYLTYKTWKREKGNNVFSVEKTFANEITKKACDLLLEMYADKRPDGCRHLYLGNLKIPQKTHALPIDKDVFSYISMAVYAYMNKFFQTIDLPEEQRKGLSTCEISKHSQIKKHLSEGQFLTYPTTIQFRVHACSELYKRGCPLAYIQRFMSHLSNEMAGYYVRAKFFDTQEDLKYASNIFKKIILKEARLLGAGADSLTGRIHMFIEENGFRIDKDLDSIVAMLNDKMPVRAKTGGVCIRSSGVRECSKDSMTNEFYCAYGVCPNIFHFFYMADVSYRQGKELIETIHLNKERGFFRQAYKESLMLNTLTTQKLIPELDELRIELAKRGDMLLKETYPELAHILTNFDSVYSEALMWKGFTV